MLSKPCARSDNIPFVPRDHYCFFPFQIRTRNGTLNSGLRQKIFSPWRGFHPLASVFLVEAMLQPSKISPGFEQHEETFLERYRRLRAWALQLTENHREQAEDLVHDTYFQFTLIRPDLKAIGNLDG